jgi:phage antirepressor YoqD-like protein
MYDDDLFEAEVTALAQKMAKDMLQESLSDPVALAQALQERNAQLTALRKDHIKTKGELQEVSADLKRLTDSDGSYDMKDAAKLIKYKRADGKQVGRTELFAFLRDIQFLNKDNTPAQSSIDKGWLDEITGTFIMNGEPKPYVKTVVTPKGTQRIRRLMESAFDDWWSEL